MKKILSAILTLLVASTLVACGGGGGTAQVQAAAADTVLPASAATVALVPNTAFQFPSGVTSFGTTSTTTVAFTSASATPTFSISSDGNTATGDTTFGSCHFHITASTFLPPSPLAVGNTITVNPCNLNANTHGQLANGQGQSRSIALLLGSALSSGTPITISINEGGQVTINGQSAGTVTLTPVTGT